MTNEEKTDNLSDIINDKRFWNIPKNSVLVVTNKYSGKNVEVRGNGEGGWTVIAPWKSGKLVSLAVRNFDYPKETFEDSFGQDVIVDLAITVKIVDPIKYQYNNENPEKELSQLISSCMRVLISQSTYDYLKKNNFSIPNDKEYQINNNFVWMCTGINDADGQPMGHQVVDSFELELINIRERLNKFAQKYGLAIEDFYCKSVDQTKDIQETYNKKIKAEKEAEELLIKKESEKKQALIDAEIKKVNAEAAAHAEKVKLKALLEVMNDTNIPKEDQMMFLQTYMYAKAENNVSGVTAAAVAGATLGATTDSFQKTNKKHKR